MNQHEPDWVLVWKGMTSNGLLAAQMLREHGLDVREDTDIATRIYVHPDDEATAQELFKDWEI